MSNNNLYPRESVEFQPVVVLVNGTVTTAPTTFSVVETGLRPSTWGTATTIGTATGVMVSGLDPGDYTVWAKVVSFPETAVIDCGFFTVT